MEHNKNPRPDGRPTLADVADRAGVSPSTVSRVVRNAVPVSPELEHAVRQAIAETGYVPNLAARRLVNNRSDAVGFIIPEDQRHVFGEPFFGQLMHGVIDVLSSTPFHVVMTVASSAHDRVWLEQFVAGGHVDGVMAIAPQRGDPLADTLKRLRVPMVLVGRPFGSIDCNYVDVDNIGGAMAAVEYLYLSGRRRIAMVSGVGSMRSSIDRVRGYQDGLASVGLDFAPELLVESDYTDLGGELAMGALIARGVDFDAVLAASDVVALGAIRTLTRSGLGVPSDVAVVGFGGDGTGIAHQPTLTTVVQPSVEMGRRAATLAVAAIEGDSTVRRVTMATELVVGETA